MSLGEVLTSLEVNLHRPQPYIACTRRNSELRVPPHLQQGEPCMSPIPRTTGGKDSNPLRDQALTSGSYGTAKVDELEKNGSSILGKACFSRGERFSAIRGSVRRGPPAAPAAGFSPYRTKLLHFFGSGVELVNFPATTRLS